MLEFSASEKQKVEGVENAKGRVGWLNVDVRSVRFAYNLTCIAHGDLSFISYHYKDTPTHQMITITGRFYCVHKPDVGQFGPETPVGLPSQRAVGQFHVSYGFLSFSHEIVAFTKRIFA